MPGHNSFNQLQLYVLSNVLWDPELDVEKEINHFMKIYYGPGAAAMREFWDLIHEQVKVNGRHFAQHTEQTKRGFVNDKFAKQAYAIFKKAEAATKGTGRYYDRVEKEKMHLLFADLSDRSISSGKISSAEMAAYAERVGEFLRIVKKFNITYFSRRGATNWFWDTMMIKVKSNKLYDDPQIKALIKNPLKTLQTALNSPLKPIAGGWIFDSSCLNGGKAYSLKVYGKNTKTKIARRPTSGISKLMVFMNLNKVPKKSYLIIEGRGNKGTESGEVILNGKKIYSSKAILSQDWGTKKIPIPTGLLKKGQNQLIFANTTPDLIQEAADKGIDYIRAKNRNYYWGWIIVSNIKLMAK
jgi:hypothetical protein